MVLSTFGYIFVFSIIIGSTHADNAYSSLDTLFLKPQTLTQLTPIIKNGVIEALKDLQGKISVLNLSLNKNVIEYDELRKCTPQAVSVLSALDLINGRDINLNGKNGIPLGRFNFALYLEINGEACHKNPKLLATARPCDVSTVQRPLLGILNICTGQHWEGFKAIKDLLRHEILHSLGFGTLIPVENTQKGHHTDTYLWNLSSGSQTANRHYLDFTGKTLAIAKHHFGCNTIEGIEADSKSSIHLNEYIFGNELMTPKLSNGPNYFTKISASILEETYLGSRQWYKVNYTSIEEEHNLYWYGRNWGCSFIQKSCFEYVKTSPIGFPFCRPDQLVVNYCIKGPGFNHKFSSKCSWTALNKNDKADNGITATPTLNSFTTGSNALFRFCPMNMNFIHEFIQIPKGGIIYNCPN